MSQARGPRALVYGALALQTAISAGTYLAGKRALGELSWQALAMLRFAGASVLLALLAAGWVRPRLPPRAWWGRLAVLGFAAVPLNQSFFLSGLARTTPAHAALMYALTPLFVFLLALAFRTERAQPAKVAGLFVALCGAALVVFERGGAQLANGSGAGDLLILGAVVAWAFYTVRGKGLVAEHGPVAATCWSLMAGTLLFVPVGAPGVAAAKLSTLSTAAWWSLAFLVVFTSVVSYLCWYYALRHLEPSRVAVFSNLQPVATAFLSWALFGEPITPRLMAGGGLVILGVLVTTQLGQRAPRGGAEADPALDSRA